MIPSGPPASALAPGTPAFCRVGAKAPVAGKGVWGLSRPIVGGLGSLVSGLYGILRGFTKSTENPSKQYLSGTNHPRPCHVSALYVLL